MTEGRSRRKLLLVEDEALIALSERKSLEKYGYEVATVLSGEQAIEAVAGGMDADLMLMDIDLGSGMDGTRAAARILELRDVPIVFLSSHTEPWIVERTEAITSYGYVVKDSSITVLDASIKMAFKLFEAKREIQKSERKQDSLIANISDVIAIFDRDGVTRYTSPNVRRWFGWEADELVGQAALGNVHPDDREASRELLDRLVSSADGTSAAAEARILCKDGSYKWIEISLVNMQGDPVIRGILGNYNDISERKRMEQESRSRLSALFGAMTEMAVLHELVFDERGRPSDYRILNCNDAFTRIMGIPKETALGRLGSEVYGSSPAPYLEEFSEVGITGKPYSYSTFYAPMKKHFSISVVSPGRNQFATITTDVTALKEAEAKLRLQVKEYEAVNEKLRSSAEELDRYFSNSLDLLCIADTDGRFIRLNPEWEKVLGYRIEDLEGKRFLDFVHPDDLEGTLDSVSALDEQRSILNFENRYRAKDGSYRWIEWRSQPHGRLIYAAARDVTERKLIEEDLQRQVEEKELLLKEVHHRIKNSLASIETLVALKDDTVECPEAKQALGETLGRIASMRILYEKLLGGEQYTESSVKDYIESLVLSLSEALVLPPGVVIRSEVEEFPLPTEKLFPLGIIVNELVTNAIKYAFQGRDRGSIEVRLSKSGPAATLEIRDDGRGLSPEPRPAEGCGFGLTLVRMLSEQLRGELSIESSGGTRAILRFPI
jgi:PAS domain S-box-containing protein